MTEESIKQFIETMKYRRYTTGVMHISEPQWIEDIRYLIKCVEFLLEKK